MDLDLRTSLFLLVDGLTNGAVYSLVGLSLVLVFTTTRVVNIAQGEYVTFGALTFASFLEGTLAPLIYVVAGGGAVCMALDVMQSLRLRRNPLRPVVAYGAAGCLLALLTYAAWQTRWTGLQMAAALALVASVGPIVYRLTVEPKPGNSTVVLVIISVGVSMIMHPLALLLWGADPRAVAPISDAGFELGGMDIAAQSLFIMAFSLVAALALYLFFHMTLTGKALRAASLNREGAQYCGIPVIMAGRLSFFLAAALSGASGMLLAPLVTAHYEMGFVIGLKGFVGAATGGLLDYPLTVLGVFIVGTLESFASFMSSSYRDAIVFALVIPIMMWRNSRAGADLDEEH
ncbi:branched-chain amino acid ABC transporter permease [Parapusillimonas granuli]|uniref:Branched-chain amino acid ABC transporter permease n=1 Tax=Parapusillimonas granuli TaxID=380911 RepID=A0A853G791_9BURK|nr:branched-chain amino acid ABC transporter permease [Parapusillimonas granuli]MBB5215872.1 branched-chain amino acid transport system permease protein [Parapusillimonas granuli]MEB2399437.1 branched-chain amino acid ABC transporter permease [Alcaligenaceae bacterium]NYT50830.1 branched-chain amino acid ABC transporter permease [Parapusillimonas granuli]